MRIFYLLVLLLLSVGVLAQQELRSVQWKKMIGWKHPEVEAYFDVRSLRSDKDSKTDIRYGMILFQRKIPIKVSVYGEEIEVTSLARYFIIDCDRTVVSVISDYYFTLTRLPVITDTPTRAIDYSEPGNLPDPKQISKSDPIYKTLCPRYI